MEFRGTEKFALALWPPRSRRINDGIDLNGLIRENISVKHPDKISNLLDVGCQIDHDEDVILGIRNKFFLV